MSGASMFLYVDSFLRYQKSLSTFLAAAYCGSFGLCVSLLATHFVYRYFAVCRSKTKANLYYQRFKCIY
uniref:CASP-like protein n=1 Tax=Caenorhabditis tropicalis TaxID=1561998 RepID=A0A1I7TAG6_9PELO